MNHAFLSALAERKPPCDSLLAAPWGDPPYAKQAAEWGPLAPPLALRSGEMNVYLIVPAGGRSIRKEPSQSPAAKTLRPSRSKWAELLRRVFVIDALTCPYCGGKRRLIALLTDGQVVRLSRGRPEALPWDGRREHTA